MVMDLKAYWLLKRDLGLYLVAEFLCGDDNGAYRYKLKICAWKEFNRNM
jgi:hypothetical protein